MKKRALARFFSHSSPALVRGAAALRFGHGQGGHVDEAAHGGAGREHMYRRGRAQQDGADYRSEKGYYRVQNKNFVLIKISLKWYPLRR